LRDFDSRLALRSFPAVAVLEAAGIPLHGLNVNPLPNESDLHVMPVRPATKSDYPTARIFSLRDGAR
jgi:hypothetical protein